MVTKVAMVHFQKEAMDVGRGFKEVGDFVHIGIE